MTATIHIELQSNLPTGYHEEDFFHDRGAFLAGRYESAGAARAAFAKQYKGADADGVGIDYVLTDSDHADVG